MADIDKIKDPPYDRYDLWRIFSYLPNKLSDSDNLQKTVAAGKPRRIAAPGIPREGGPFERTK